MIGRSERIYFDNAATSWPKPPTVAAAVQEQLTNAGGNPGRSGHRLSIASARVVEETLEALARLFHAAEPSRFALTPNATHALNVALYGLLRPGDRVMTTSMEHNSVMRPLRHLETRGVCVVVVPCSLDGSASRPGWHFRWRRSRRARRFSPAGPLMQSPCRSQSLGALAWAMCRRTARSRFEHAVATTPGSDGRANERHALHCETPHTDVELLTCCSSKHSAMRSVSLRATCNRAVRGGSLPGLS
jgi:hypothetical protein